MGTIAEFVEALSEISVETRVVTLDVVSPHGTSFLSEKGEVIENISRNIQVMGGRVFRLLWTHMGAMLPPSVDFQEVAAACVEGVKCSALDVYMVSVIISSPRSERWLSDLADETSSPQNFGSSFTAEPIARWCSVPMSSNSTLES